MKYLYMLMTMLFLVSYHDHQLPTQEQIKARKKMVRSALKYPTNYNFIAGHEIKNEYQAIDFAEPILFEIYGKDEIRDERPYSIDLIDGYWVLDGWLPPKTHGGVFQIIFSAKEGRVIKLEHQK